MLACTALVCTLGQTHAGCWAPQQAAFHDGIVHLRASAQIRMTQSWFGPQNAVQIYMLTRRRKAGMFHAFQEGSWPTQGWQGSRRLCLHACAVLSLVHKG